MSSFSLDFSDGGVWVDTETPIGTMGHTGSVTVSGKLGVQGLLVARVRRIEAHPHVEVEGLPSEETQVMSQPTTVVALGACCAQAGTARTTMLS